MRARKWVFSTWRGPGLAPALHPVVIAAARDQQGLTQPGYFVLAAHRLDSGIPLGGTSERMPSDFFKHFTLLQELGVLRAQAPDLRLQFLHTAPSLPSSAGEWPGRRSLLRPAVEQRRTDAQLGRHLGGAAAAGAPQLQRLLFVLLGVSRAAREPACLTVSSCGLLRVFDPKPTVRQIRATPP